MSAAVRFMPVAMANSFGATRHGPVPMQPRALFDHYVGPFRCRTNSWSMSLLDQMATKFDFLFPSRFVVA